MEIKLEQTPQAPESTPLFNPKELKEEAVNKGIGDRSKEYFEALDGDKAPSPKTWNRFLQFQVARKRAEQDPGEFELDPQGRRAVEQCSKSLTNDSTWGDEDGNIDFLSVAQAAMALRYLGTEVKFSDAAAQKLQKALREDDQFKDVDKALRYGIALKNLRTFDSDGKATSLFSDGERHVLAQQYKGFLADESEPIERKVLRLAQLDKLGIVADLDKRGRDMPAAGFYKQQVAGKLMSAAKDDLTTSTLSGRGERRRLLKALAVSKSVFEDPIPLNAAAQEVVRTLVREDKDEGKWKEYLDDAIIAKQLQGNVVVQQATEEYSAASLEPKPSPSPDETVPDKLDGTMTGSGSQRPEPIPAVPETKQPNKRGFNELSNEILAKGREIIDSKDPIKKERLRKERQLLQEELKGKPVPGKNSEKSSGPEPVVDSQEPKLLPEKGFLDTVNGAREWLREHPKAAKAIMGAAGVGALAISGGLWPVVAVAGVGYFAIWAGRKELQKQGEKGYWSAIKNVFIEERSIITEQLGNYGRYVKRGKGFWRKLGRVFTGMSNN